MATKTHIGPGNEIVVEVSDGYINSRTLFVEPFDTTVLLTLEAGGEIAAQFNISPKEFAALAVIVAELDRIGAFSGR